jgi:hypothetical protein
VEVLDQSLAITELGKTFTSHLCGIFDAYIPKGSSSPCSTPAS